jgi:hypothetical protein
VRLSKKYLSISAITHGVSSSELLRCYSIPYRVLKSGIQVEKRQTVHLHRLVFFTFCGEKVLPWMHQGNIDHINRNKADNRFVNLRYATTRENNQNSTNMN